MSTKLDISRLVVQTVASVGVSKVVNDMIKNNTTIETTADAVKVWSGSVVLGSMIAVQASKHVNERIDAVIAWNEGRKTATAASV
jgi:hypothetical protein